MAEDRIARIVELGLRAEEDRATARSPWAETARSYSHAPATWLQKETGLGFQTSRVLLALMRDPTRYPLEIRATILLSLLEDRPAVELLTSGGGVMPVYGRSGAEFSYPAYWREPLVKEKKS